MTYDNTTRLLLPSPGCAILRRENDWLLPDGIYIAADEQVEDYYEKPLSAIDMTRVPNNVEPARELMLAKIDAYDTGTSVRQFVVNGHPIWIDKTVRDSIVASIDACVALGREEATITLGDMVLTARCDTLKTMLQRMQLYGMDCNAVTMSHKNVIKALTSTIDIDHYDYKSGYPPLLEFQIPTR